MTTPDDTVAGRGPSLAWTAIRYHPLIVVMGGILGLALTIAGLALVPVTQTADSTLLLRPLDGNPYSSEAARDPAVELQTESQVARSEEMAVIVIDELGIDTTPAALRADVTTRVPNNTQLIEVSYTGAEAGEAERIAQSFADQYLLYRVAQAESFRTGQSEALDRQIASAEDDLDELVQRPDGSVPNSVVNSSTQDLLELRAEREALSALALDPGEVIVPARAESGAMGVLRALLPFLGLVLGLLVGIGAAIWREHSRGVVRHVDDIEHLGLAVVTVVPSNPSGAGAGNADQRLALRGLVTAVHRQMPAPSAVAVVPVQASVDSATVVDAAASASRGESSRLAVVHGSDAYAGRANQLDVPELSEAAVREMVTALKVGDSEAPALAHRIGLDPRTALRFTGSPGGPVSALVCTPTPDRPVAQALIAASDASLLLVELGRTRRQDVETAVTAAAYLGVPVVGVAALESPARGVGVGFDREATGTDEDNPQGDAGGTVSAGVAANG